ncbi:hypothetical protein D3C73_565520 [compost metagenome]
MTMTAGQDILFRTAFLKIRVHLPAGCGTVINHLSIITAYVLNDGSGLTHDR